MPACDRTQFAAYPAGFVVMPGPCGSLHDYRTVYTGHPHRYPHPGELVLVNPDDTVRQDCGRTSYGSATVTQLRGPALQLSYRHLTRHPQLPQTPRLPWMPLPRWWLVDSGRPRFVMARARTLPSNPGRTPVPKDVTLLKTTHTGLVAAGLRAVPDYLGLPHYGHPLLLNLVLPHD